jgi:hypothetical protein
MLRLCAISDSSEQVDRGYSLEMITYKTKPKNSFYHSTNFTTNINKSRNDNV